MRSNCAVSEIKFCDSVLAQNLNANLNFAYYFVPNLNIFNQDPDA